jgi:hypothetical protein
MYSHSSFIITIPSPGASFLFNTKLTGWVELRDEPKLTHDQRMILKQGEATAGTKPPSQSPMKTFYQVHGSFMAE